MIVVILLAMNIIVVGKGESIDRADFPRELVFGTASSAYQFEGPGSEGNRKMSIWDTFSRKPGRILDFSNFDRAVDHYIRFKVGYRNQPITLYHEHFRASPCF